MPARAYFRAFERREVSLPATLGTESDSNIPARLLNIGLGGACCEIANPLAVGQRITLEVSTPTLWDPLIVPACVAWARPAPGGSQQVGMRFEHERATAVSALVELLGSKDFE